MMDKKEIADYVKSRDEALIDFVMTDSMEKIDAHLEKYNPGLFKGVDLNIKKGSLYKAVQECTDIPEDVKATAFAKCSMLGFKPRIDWSHNDR